MLAGAVFSPLVVGTGVFLSINGVAEKIKVTQKR